MKQLKTIHILGIITLAAVIFGNGTGECCLLWICYGIYKAIQTDII